MIAVTASAPGKVFVSGEYAVLRGAPAVVMAVNRRARVQVDAAGAGIEIRGNAEATDTRILDAVCTVLGIERPDAGVLLDTAAFGNERGKYGIGSSAALTVALTAALMREDRPNAILPAALTANRQAQGGGSGADIASSVAGGIIAYRMDELSWKSLKWPDGLHAALLYTGQPAGTVDLVAAFDARAAGAAVQALGAAAECAARAWQVGEAAGVLDAQRDFAAALQALDEESGLRIYAGGHREIAASASAEPAVVYKPCGAGGGDLGLALSLDEARLGAFVERAVEQGAERLALEIDPRGVHCEVRD